MACPAAVPVDNIALPEAPVVVDPVKNCRAPLTPAVPAPALSTLTLPEDLDVEDPEVTEITPPVLAAEMPLDTDTWPAGSALTPVPPETTIAPDTEPADLT